MYEFFFGVLVGSVAIIKFRKKSQSNVHTQADEYVIQTSRPILIPKKKFVPGELENFWENS